MFNPEIWLESAIRELKAYVGTGLHNSVHDNLGNPAGLYPTNPNGVYELVMEFPTPESIRQKVPLARTMVHFEVDAIDDRPVGIGGNILRLNYDAPSQTVTPQEAFRHEINFDVGIWTSDRAGGITSRMRVYQTLTNLLQGKLGQQALDAASNGGDGRIEIINFTGGRFITETVNDVVTYRSVDGVLEVRVFSRTPMSMATSVPTIEEILQEPGLTIVP